MDDTNKIDDSTLKTLFKIRKMDDNKSEELAVEPYSYWKAVFRQFFSKKSVYVAIIIFAILIIYGYIIPFFLGGTVTHDFDTTYESPSLAHIFGKDHIGRDLFHLCSLGLRLSLSLAVIVALINTVVGIILGSIWGYFRKLDLFFNEFYNVISNIPGLLKYFIFLMIFNTMGIGAFASLVLSMTIVGWLGTARLVRNRIIIFNNREFNIASRTLGSGAKTIIMYNLLPQILTILITTIALSIPAYISAEVTLSYFGIGLPPNAISLGKAIKEGYYGFMEHPHVLAFPVAILSIFTITIYLVGQILADSIDPKTHR